MKTIYIIFSTIDIGGAEKRFTGLWRSFQQQNNSGINVKLVMNPQLYNKLKEINEIGDDNNIVIAQLQGNNFNDYRKNVRAFIKNSTNTGDIIHFIGISPLLIPYKRKTIFSLTNSSLNLAGTSNKTVILLSSWFANAVDVLDPGVFKKIRSLFFWKKTILQTSNSFCDTNLFKPLPYNEKNDWIVFLGRFDSVKQVLEITEALPEIYESLQAMGKHNVKFFLLGYGELEEKIKALVSAPRYDPIPIVIGFEKAPHKILNASKIFLSLQLYNNYPSKSLLEAMAAGNIPVVTDVGHTRWLAKPGFSYYMPERFTKQNLANTVRNIFAMDDNEWKQKMAAAREAVLNDHSIEKMKQYYLKIYTTL